MSKINQIQGQQICGLWTTEDQAHHLAKLRDAEAKKRRNRIAEGFAYALVASEAHHINYIPSVAIDLADALIAELDKQS
jgi:hypothetical protein